MGRDDGWRLGHMENIRSIEHLEVSIPSFSNIQKRLCYNYGCSWRAVTILSEL